MKQIILYYEYEEEETVRREQENGCYLKSRIRIGTKDALGKTVLLFKKIKE